MTLALAALILPLISLAACQYAGQSGNPVARYFTWFDYLGAENLKAACGQGASERLRFFYRGIFDTQIQSYDVPGLRGGRVASVSSWTRGAGDLTKGLAITNLLFSWRGTRVNSVLRPPIVRKPHKRISERPVYGLQADRPAAAIQRILQGGHRLCRWPVPRECLAVSHG